MTKYVTEKAKQSTVHSSKKVTCKDKDIVERIKDLLNKE